MGTSHICIYVPDVINNPHLCSFDIHGDVVLFPDPKPHPVLDLRKMLGKATWDPLYVLGKKWWRKCKEG